MEERILIFGAHSRARTIAYYLKYINPNITIESYIIDNDEENDKYIDGIPVLKLENETTLDVSLPVYIGTRGANFKPIIEHLTRVGFLDIRPVTVELDIDIRNSFLKKYYAENNKSFEKIEFEKDSTNNDEEGATCSIFVIGSSFDKPLELGYKLSEYEVPLQVGTDVSQCKLEYMLNRKVSFFDNCGYNISKKNKQFCETTGLYYIWKNIISNTSESYIGMCHYRRHFILPDNWQIQLLKKDIDVILPVPLFVVPSVRENFCNRHGRIQWETMMKSIEKHDKDMYISAKEYFDNGLYSPCNMFIAKKEIVDEMCQFIFPILFDIASKIGEIEDGYQNRYPAFLAERLMSLFFDTNREKYHIVYADKNFLK